MRLLTKLSAAASSAAPSTVISAPAQRDVDGSVRVPAHERVVLANGITLLIVPRREVPLVAFHAVLKGGALGDPVGKPGVAALVAGLLEKGGGGRDAFAFADAVEGAGGSFLAAPGAESISVSGQFLARDQQLMLSLLADALLAPRFEPAEFAKLRARRIELIKAAKDSDPAELIGTYGRALLFGGHPYGRPVTGSEDSLAAITHRDIGDYYRAECGADRLILVFAGDVDAAALTRAVTKAFGRWRNAGTTAGAVGDPPRMRERRVLLIDSPESAQTYFWIANVGVDKHYPGRAALDLVNTLYGGRFTSVLNTELRIKAGLTYSARSGFTSCARRGEFAIRTFTDSENTGRALDLTLATLVHLKRDGITAQMLESARAYVLGQYSLNFETAADWAATLGELELFGLDARYIENYAPALRQVSMPDTRVVIDTVFPDPDGLAIVLIGDAEKIRAQVRKYGPVTEMLLTQPAFAP